MKCKSVHVYLCCAGKSIYSPKSFYHGFEVSTCAYLKGSQAGDARFSKVVIVISKEMTLNSQKWEDRKSLKDHKIHIGSGET